jgi:hypothetical protein
MDELRKTRLNVQNLEEYISSIQCIRGQSIFINPDELPERIVAIGDIHGDLEALFSILLKSGIIDINGKWIAVNTFLVQTGDIFDKGRLKPPLQSVGEPQSIIQQSGQRFIPYSVIDKHGNAQTISMGVKNNFEFGEVGDELIILKFLTDLHQQATTKFGNSRVLLCSGNHEFMNTSVYEYFSDTPSEEVERIVQEGTNPEIQAEINKRRIRNFVLSADVVQNRASLSKYTGISHNIDHQYPHPMDTVLFGGPEFPLRREIFRHGSGYLARKLACILNVIVVVGDFIFSHGGISPVNLRSINDISELQTINDIFRDYLLGNPTNPDDIERYFTSDSSILWNRNLGKELAPDRWVCQNILEFMKNKLHRPNLNIVVGHDIQGTCIDPIADADRSLPRVRIAWNRPNADGSVSKCITLPTVWCNNQIYRIDTGISRMNNSPDYRTPNEGNLNSLIIDLNPDGSKKNVSAMNGILGLHAPIRR